MNVFLKKPFSYITKHLISATREIAGFVFPRLSMFPSTSSRETLRLLGKQNSLFPSGADIKCILAHQTKRRGAKTRVASDQAKRQ